VKVAQMAASWFVSILLRGVLVLLLIGWSNSR